MITKETKLLRVPFNDDMVRAVLDEAKTQMRLPVKPQPTNDGDFWSWDEDGIDPYHCRNTTLELLKGIIKNRCPFGQLGDLLWVQESFDIESFGGGVAQIRYRADGKRGDRRGVSDHSLPCRIGYVCSIHMPQHCSRITLEVTDVRVEQLQDISEADAHAEGMGAPLDITGISTITPNIEWFRDRWDSIYAKDNLGWNENPWVRVVEFRRVEP